MPSQGFIQDFSLKGPGNEARGIHGGCGCVSPAQGYAYTVSLTNILVLHYW